MSLPHCVKIMRFLFSSSSSSRPKAFCAKASSSKAISSTARRKQSTTAKKKEEDDDENSAPLGDTIGELSGGGGGGGGGVELSVILALGACCMVVCCRGERRRAKDLIDMENSGSGGKEAGVHSRTHGGSDFVTVLVASYIGPLAFGWLTIKHGKISPAVETNDDDREGGSDDGYKSNDKI
ncbi:hypothetical protein LguiA_015108 [Lonicera macranthoides]